MTTALVPTAALVASSNYSAELSVELSAEVSVELSDERLEAELITLASGLAAGTARWLLLVAEYDRREVWKSWECRSMAHWLAVHVGVSLVTARQYVLVASNLVLYPKLRDAFLAGKLSYSRVRAACRCLTPETETDVVELALHATAPQLERIAAGVDRARRRNDAESAERQFDSRFLRLSYDDDGTCVIHGRVPAEIGASLIRALQFEVGRQQELAALQGVDAAEFRSAANSSEHVQVDALLRLVEAGHVAQEIEFAVAKHAAKAERHCDDSGVCDDSVVCDDSERELEALRVDTVVDEQRSFDDDPPELDASVGDAHASHVVEPRMQLKSAKPMFSGRFTPPRSVTDEHLDERLNACVTKLKQFETVRGRIRPLIVVHRYPNGDELETGPAIPSVVADRLRCGSDTITATHQVNERGEHEIRLSKRRRMPTVPERRSLHERDQCCRAPGCGKRRNLHVHHLIEYGKGGLTTRINLVMLCPEHHRLVHDRGWILSGNPDMGPMQLHPPGRKPVSANDVNIEKLMAELHELAAHSGPVTPLARGERFDLEYAVSVHLANEQAAESCRGFESHCGSN